MPLQIAFSEMNTLPIFRGYFRQLFPLSLTSSACVKSSCLLTISTDEPALLYMPLPQWILSPSFGGTLGNFRPLSLTTSTCVNLHRDLYHYFERALSPTCEHYVMLMDTLAILRGTFGDFWPLSLTTSVCVNLHINLLLITSNAHYSKYLNAFASFAQTDLL